MWLWKGIIIVCVALGRSCGQICGNLCDGDDASRASNPRKMSSEIIFSRKVTLFLSDGDNVGFAKIENGDPGDEVWVDRSFNAGRDWQGRIGLSVIADGSREVTGPVFNADGSLDQQQIGILRACGKAGNRVEIVCTPWYRPSAHGEYPALAAATTLMMFFTSAGLWDTTGWWNAANCLTALVDFMKVTGDRTYLFAIERTFEENRGDNFCNHFMDDTGWWGLAWVGTYDLTGDRKYLDMAATTARYMHDFIDDRCGGGVYWSGDRGYKNAISNELFIKLTASLHNRLEGDSEFLGWSVAVWQWFDNSGMINGENLINDGLNTMDDCKNNKGITWTYNQGVILGGLVELAKATGEAFYLDRARAIADSATGSTYLNNNGILHEPCDHDRIDCGADGQTFKGVFARNLGELNDALPDTPYTEYIENNGNAIQSNGNSFAEYGLHYEGPFEFFSAGTQQSAFDMLIAQQRAKTRSDPLIHHARNP